MNKKTFTVAVIFLIVTLVWLGVNIFWALSNKNCIFDLIVAVLFALAGAGMVYNECHKRKCRAPRRGEPAPDSLTEGGFAAVSECRCRVSSGRAPQLFCGVWRAGKRTIGTRGSVQRFVQRFCVPVRAARRLRRPAPGVGNV